MTRRVLSIMKASDLPAVLRELLDEDELAEFDGMRDDQRRRAFLWEVVAEEARQIIDAPLPAVGADEAFASVQRRTYDLWAAFDSVFPGPPDDDDEES